MSFPPLRYRNLFSVALLCLSGSSLSASIKADVELWRLDCGEMIIEDIHYFSDTHAYDGQSATISNGCYLIRNGARFMLWDAGIPREYLGNTEFRNGWLSTISVTIEEQLKRIGLKTSDIDFLGISHFHGDHIGQAAAFSGATLLMNSADIDWIRNDPAGSARLRLSPWFDDKATIVEFAHDFDVFGDGTVNILATPGHTPGHSALLVRLTETGYVLLSGDLFHFHSEIGRRNVSRWNTSRADTLASIERFMGILENIKPVVIVQHDPNDIDRLPPFPESAR